MGEALNDWSNYNSVGPVAACLGKNLDGPSTESDRSRTVRHLVTTSVGDVGPAALDSLTLEILYKRVKIFACHAEHSEASRSWLVERDSSLAPLAQNDAFSLVGLRRSFAD
jgi:hypothetical protein